MTKDAQEFERLLMACEVPPLVKMGTDGMLAHYILEGDTPRKVTCARDALEAMLSVTKPIACDQVGPYKVSTIFLATNMNFLKQYGPPIVFETMVFDERGSECWQDRCGGTTTDAMEMHWRMVREVQKGVADEG